MCKVIDDILPIVGAVVGTVIAPGVGTAIGAGLGGFAGNYAQTHNFGSAALGGLMAGGASALGGGLGSLMGTGAESAASIAPDAFSTGMSAAGTTGGLESSLGGAAMFGANAGTGTALGSAATGLGGESLGVAGGDALSGVTANGFTGQLGGAGTGTSLPGQSASNLNGVMANAPTQTGAVTGAPSGAATPQASPTSSLANTGSQSMGITDPSGTGGSMEGVQAAPAPQGGAFAAGAAGGGTESGAATPNLSTLYGPDSVASQSPMGSSIADNTGGVGGNVTANPSTLGQGKSAMDLSSLFGGNSNAGAQGGGMPNNMSDLMSLFQQSQANPWAKLLQTGLGAYQQFGQQNAQNAYKNQIDQEFSPNSPYAQQMSQTLGRQDAAAGRNSQYGTRAVQLAAALTQAHANALANSNYYKAATATPGLNALNGLFANFGSNQGMQQLQQMGTGAFNSLQSLFGG